MCPRHNEDRQPTSVEWNAAVRQRRKWPSPSLPTQRACSLLLSCRTLARASAARAKSARQLSTPPHAARPRRAVRKSAARGLHQVEILPAQHRALHSVRPPETGSPSAVRVTTGATYLKHCRGLHWLSGQPTDRHLKSWQAVKQVEQGCRREAPANGSASFLEVS